MNKNTITLITTSPTIHIILFREKIISAVKDQIQHILTLPKEAFFGFALIGKTFFCNLLVFPFFHINQHDTIIKIFATF